MPKEIGNTYRGIMALMHASEDGIHGRVRLQKLAYFAGLAGALDFTGVKFQHQQFGPYSRRISDCLQWLVAAGMVKESSGSGDDTQARYTYTLTDEGKAWMSENESEDFSKLERIAYIFANADIRAVELAAVTRLLQQKSPEDDEGEAFELAIKRDPQWEAVKVEAKKLLDTFITERGKQVSVSRMDL